MSVLIHIGSSKALSTTFQSNFQNLKKNFYYFGKNIDEQKLEKKGMGDFYEDEDCRKLTHILVNLEKFKGLDPKLKENIQKKVKKAEQDNKIFLYSCELFCESQSIYLLMTILKDLFGNFKVLFILRDQISAIKSLYTYEGHKQSFLNKNQNYKFVTFKDFFETGKRQIKLTGGHKSNYWCHDFFRIFNYNSTIEIIESVIPKENIYVYPMEEIQEKKDLNILVDFIKKNLNIDITHIQPTEKLEKHSSLNESNKQSIFFGIYRLLTIFKINPYKLNNFVKKFFKYKFLLKFLPKKKLMISEKHQEEIKKEFLEGNQKLINKFPKIKEYEDYYLFSNIKPN